MNNTIDTIVAISTPKGRGGIGIIRISGTLVPIIIPQLFNKTPQPRKAEYLPFLSRDGSILEKVITLFFPEPNSITGENILEIHGHGGEIILDLLLEQILKTSTKIRLAHPGEFTERAFLNGKIDLIQAEAVSDIINATSYQAAKSASNSLQGHFSNQIHKILKKITNLRVYVESSIDFVEEKIPATSYDNIQHHLQNIINNTTQIYHSAQYGVLLQEGINVVIAGKPNAGKSSLFNKLIDMDRAIVSKISGTTRDTLHECIQLNGITLHITDTAGIKKNSDNEIEQIGIQRAWNKLNHADHILWIIDASEYVNQNNSIILNKIKNIFSNQLKTTPITIVCNKSDLTSEKIGINTIQGYTFINISALFNHGIDILKKHLSHNTKSMTRENPLCYSNLNENQGNFIARRRHLDALDKSIQYLISAQTQLTSNIAINDLFAEDIKLAQNELNKIIGTFTSNDLLKQIFSKFCIGK